MSSYSRLGLAAVLLAAGFGTLSAKADTLTLFTLDDVAFDDGGTASGTFTFNSTADTITEASITTTDGLTLSSTNYATNPSDFVQQTSDGLTLFAFLDNTDRILDLYVADPVSLSSSDALVTEEDPSEDFNYSQEFTNSETGGSRGVLTGALDAPEPASLALLATGLVGLGFARRRRMALA